MQANAKFSVLLALQAALLALFIVSQFQGKTNNEDANRDLYRDIAAKLHSAGVHDEAAHYYEKYLDQGNLPADSKASIAFSLGQMYEEAMQPEKALAYFYQVGLVDAKSKHKDEAAKRIVALLEKMKKFAAAKYELGEQTKLDTADEPKGAVVIAKIDGQNIYLHQIHAAIDQLPDYAKASIKSPEGQEAFAKKYVADELLYGKALRLGYDKDAKIAKDLETIQKQMLVQKVLETELADKMKADPDDIKNYFEANKSKYSQKESAKVSVLKIKDKKAADALYEKLKAGENFDKVAKENNATTSELTQEAPFFSLNAADKGKLLALAKGEVSAPMLAEGHFLLVKVLDRKAGQEANFEDAKGRVEQDYKMEKGQRAYQELLDETLKTNKVEFFLDKLKAHS